MNFFKSIKQFLVNSRHQLYIYVGIFFILVSVLRLTLFEFITDLNLYPKEWSLLFGKILEIFIKKNCL